MGYRFGTPYINRHVDEEDKWVTEMVTHCVPPLVAMVQIPSQLVGMEHHHDEKGRTQITAPGGMQ